MNFFEMMSRNTGEGIFIKHRVVRGVRVLSGCLYCHGALFRCPSIAGPDSGPGVLKCFHCGRMFLNYRSHLKLWPHREYEHLKKSHKTVIH